MNGKALQRWRKENGDYTHRVNYDLNEDSIVFDVGGYKGEWAKLIADKYDSNIFIFEPIPEFYNNIKKEFEHNPKVQVFNFGLSTSIQQTQFYLNKDSTSQYHNHKNRGRPVNVELKDFKEVFKSIDLLKLNIEGEEYPLIQYIIDEDMIGKIDNLQVQFHEWVEDSHEKRKTLHEALSKTHELTYNFEFVWENWKRKCQK